MLILRDWPSVSDGPITPDLSRWPIVELLESGCDLLIGCAEDIAFPELVHRGLFRFGLCFGGPCLV